MYSLSDFHSLCFGSWRKCRGETFIKYPSGIRSIPPTLCFRHPSTLSPCEIILIKECHPVMTDLPPARKIHSQSSQFCQPQITPQCIQHVYLSAGCICCWTSDYTSHRCTHIHTPWIYYFGGHDIDFPKENFLLALFQPASRPDWALCKHFW